MGPNWRIFRQGSVAKPSWPRTPLPSAPVIPVSFKASESTRTRASLLQRAVEPEAPMPHRNLHRRGFLSWALAGLSCPVQAQPTIRRTASALLAASRAQVGVTVGYDPAYTQLAFPDGDVHRSTGVCTDVIVRAYRDAFGLDLQALVHADMRAAFSAYPQRWGAARPDRNIDHRRVPNQETFFTRANAKLPLPPNLSDWRPGDMFTALIGNRLPHIGFISDRSHAGRPLIIHNIGAGTREEDALTAHPLTGRYRWGLEG